MVARWCAGLLNEDVDSFWNGYAFESIILNELNIYNEISKKHRGIYFYDSPGSGEVDFIIETRKKTINKQNNLLALK